MSRVTSVVTIIDIRFYVIQPVLKQCSFTINKLPTREPRNENVNVRQRFGIRRTITVKLTFNE